MHGTWCWELSSISSDVGQTRLSCLRAVYIPVCKSIAFCGVAKAQCLFVFWGALYNGLCCRHCGWCKPSSTMYRSFSREEQRNSRSLAYTNHISKPSFLRKEHTLVGSYNFYRVNLKTTIFCSMARATKIGSNSGIEARKHSKDIVF